MDSRFDPFGNESGIFRDMKVNTIVAVGLASCVARSSAARVLSKQDKYATVFYVWGFQPLVLSQCAEMTQNVIRCFLKQIQYGKD